MSRNLKIGIAVAVAISAVIIIGILIRNRHGQSTQEVKVGAVIPLTGDVATYGESLKKGFDLAAEDYKGQIQIVYEDSKASPKDGVSEMEKLLSQGVRHFLGDATSGVCLAMVPLADRDHALLMISVATSDDLSKAGPYVFRNCPPNQRQAVTAANFFKDTLKATKIAVLAKANPYGANLAAKFREEAAPRGLQIVLDEQYDASLKDFGTIIEKVRKSAPDALFIPGNYEETALILRKARELGLAVPIVGTDGAYSPKLVELAGPAAEGFYLTMLGIDAAAPFYQNFDSKFKSRYHSDPDVFAAYGYEGALVLFQTIHGGGSIDEQRQRLAFAKTPGLLGDISFDANGQVVRPVGIMRVVKGRFEPYAGRDTH